MLSRRGFRLRVVSCCRGGRGSGGRSSGSCGGGGSASGRSGGCRGGARRCDSGRGVGDSTRCCSLGSGSCGVGLLTLRGKSGIALQSDESACERDQRIRTTRHAFQSNTMERVPYLSRATCGLSGGFFLLTATRLAFGTEGVDGGRRRGVRDGRVAAALQGGEESLGRRDDDVVQRIENQVIHSPYDCVHAGQNRVTLGVQGSHRPMQCWS